MIHTPNEIIRRLLRRQQAGDTSSRGPRPAGAPSPFRPSHSALRIFTSALILLPCGLLPALHALGAPPAPLTSVITMQPDLDRKYQKNCLSEGCHTAPALPGTPQHPPFREGHCLACHEDHATSQTRLLKTTGNAMCLACHTGMNFTTGTQTLAHPAGGQLCITCHNPHQSGERNLMRSRDGLLICAQCHADFLKQAAKLPYRHHYLDPQTECGSCHYAHRRPEQHYLRENVSETCLTCHDLALRSGNRVLENVAEQIHRAPVVHGALAKGSCATCHTPHGSQQPSLLKAGYPAGNYETYRPEQYTLCWQCHPKGLAESSRGEGVTGFRNGEVNLHWLHVSRLKQGRACHLCHTAHASQTPHLLRETVQFNQWQAPLNYKVLPEGGSCLTPCHRLREYSRLRALDNGKKQE